MAKDITQEINFTKRGAKLGTFFQARPDVWLKRLRNVCYFQAIAGFVALFVWIITWLKGMDKLLPDYGDVTLSASQQHSIGSQHGSLFGGHVAMAVISGLVGAAGGAAHGSSSYNRAVCWVVVALDVLLAVGYSLTYYFSIAFYRKNLDEFNTAVVGGLVASCLSGFFTLVAGGLELVCVLVPAPEKKPDPPVDPFNRTVDPERIPFLILELQDAFNYVLFNRNNMQNMNISFQPGFQPHAPPFPLGLRNQGQVPEGPYPYPVYPFHPHFAQGASA